jgi:amino acid adenylation domain-containing protein
MKQTTMGTAPQLRVPAHLTVAQTAIWLDQQLFGRMPIYNTGQALTIHGPLRADLFEMALHETIAESPALRLAPGRGAIGLALQQHDLRQAPDPHAAAEQWMRTEMAVPFSLDEEALYRFALLRIADDLTIWFQKYHHIIIDATGRWLLSARTATRYRALRLGQTAPELQAATLGDVIDQERDYEQSADHARDRSYWLARFAHLPESLLPADRESSERGRSGRHARITFTLPRSDFARLERAAKAMGSAASRAIIALTYAAFARFYDREHIVLGIELANRSSAVAKQMVGILARPLPLGLSADSGASISEVLRQVDEARALDYPHRHFPIQELVTALGLLRQGRHGLFDVVVNYVPAAYEFAFEDEPVEITNLSYGFAAPWMVTIADTGLGRDLDVAIDTDPGLINSETAARLATCLETLLLQGLEEPHRPVAQLPIMPEAARQELRAFGSGRTVNLAEGETLASLFRAQAQRQPEAVALICGEEELTFGVLEARAARLARRLSGIGVAPGVIVGIALPRTASLLVAVIAVHQAGGAYLPLDPSYPSERLRYIVADSAVPVILTTADVAPLFADSGARVLQDIEAADAGIEFAEPTPPQSHDRAYVLYTSGSTGRPKPVGIEHRSLVNLVCWGRSVLSDQEIRGVLFSTSLNFDIAAFEIFLPLAFGGCIVMTENLLALPTSPHRGQVRFINTGPSLIQALLRNGGLPAGVTTVLLAGERLPRHVVSELFARSPGVRILNCYGPTETTVYSSCGLIDPAAHSDPSIGRPIWNTTFHVLSSTGALLPLGQEGELFIGGAGVAPGYLGRPELTAERFLSFEGEFGRLYRTGDRVRWRPDGDMEFLGRADDQIKINGVRIEPGEIEAALLAVQGISMAAVMLCEDDDGLRRLTAYLVPTDGVASDTERVRAAVAQQLPRYMVPVAFIWLQAMPMTPNGKLNRKALPSPPRQQSRPASTHRPETGLERELARMWGDVLGTSPLDAGLDFFDLGGDSLALLGLFAAIEARFGRRLSVDALAGGLTVAKLAQLLAKSAAPRMTSNQIVELQPHGRLPPLFMVPGVGGAVLQLHRLSVHMGQERPVYTFRWPAEGTDSATVGELAASHVSAMLAIQPTGPFYIGGYCLGATLAYEMACQLRQLGHEIGMLAILDQRSMNWRLTVGGLLPALYHAMLNTLHMFRHEAAPLATTRRIARGVKGRVRRWARLAMGLPAEDDAGDIFELSRSLHGDIPGEQYLPALRSYRPAPLRLPVALFRATEMTRPRMLMDATLGWGRLTGGEVEVHWLAGDHLSITMEPLVRQLATLLSDALDKTQVLTKHERGVESGGSSSTVSGLRDRT